MAIKKNRSRRGSPGNKEYHRDARRPGNTRISYDKNEDRYEGYDAERTNVDPNYQSDQDADDVNAGNEGDNNYDNNIKGVSSNRNSELRRSFDRGLGDNYLTPGEPGNVSTRRISRSSNRRPSQRQSKADSRYSKRYNTGSFHTASGRKGYGGGRRRENNAGR